MAYIGNKLAETFHTINKTGVYPMVQLYHLL